VIAANIRDAAQRIIDDFTARKLTIVTAESCTGGLVGGALTEIAGSSAAVLCGFITYSNEAKHRMLGVPLETLQQFGAVSRQTALAMAQGALKNSDATVSVSITGIAGPGGGSAEKPVGLVHFAAAKRGGNEIAREMRFGEIGRSAVRERAVLVALEMLAEVAG